MKNVESRIKTAITDENLRAMHANRININLIKYWKINSTRDENLDVPVYFLKRNKYKQSEK
jgi:hypothetical protein